MKRWSATPVAVAVLIAAALITFLIGHSKDTVVILAIVVFNGVVGFAGLGVTVATLRAGKRLGLANKESLVVAGPLLIDLARRCLGPLRRHRPNPWSGTRPRTRCSRTRKRSKPFVKFSSACWSACPCPRIWWIGFT